jgi:hypothetical protein
MHRRNEQKGKAKGKGKTNKEGGQQDRLNNKGDNRERERRG